MDAVTLALAKKYSDNKGGYVEKSVITYDGNGEKIDLLGDGSTFAKISDNPVDLSTAKQVKVFTKTEEKYLICDAVYTTETGIGFLAYGDAIFAISAPQNNEAGLASGLYVFDGTYMGVGATSGRAYYCASIETETIHPIDPKFLPGVCLPVVELETALSDIPGVAAPLSENDVEAIKAVASAPFILSFTMDVVPITAIVSGLAMEEMIDLGAILATGAMGVMQLSVGSTVADGSWGIRLDNLNHA